jgi:hypothetical protein
MHKVGFIIKKTYTKYAIKYQETYVIYHQQVMKAEIHQTSSNI